MEEEPVRGASVPFDNPPATLTAFVYDERPCLNLMRSLVRDARSWPTLCILDKSKDALISRARSDVATAFLEQGVGDVLIMVDHDIGWEAGDLQHLTRVCLDLKAVVGGVFPKRGFGLGAPIRWGQYGTYSVPSDRVVECSAVATGFIAIHRSVLEAMAPTLPMTTAGYRPFFVQHTIQREDGLWDDLSEDYDFCQKARALGFHIFADLRPQLTHFGSHLYRLGDAVRYVPEAAGGVELVVKDPKTPLALADGVQMWVDPDDRFVSEALVRVGEWEPEVAEVLRQELLPTDVVVEVGAHIGVHTVQMARLLGQGRVVAVEPQPRMAGLLRRNIALNEVEARVDVWETALINEDDLRPIVRMIVDTHNPGASHLVPEDTFGTDVAAGRLVDVTQTVDVLKIDAEGAEYAILQGPRTAELLQGCRMVVTEYCEAQLQDVSGVGGREYLALLAGLGFTDGLPDYEDLPKGRAYCNIVVKRPQP